MMDLDKEEKYPGHIPQFINLLEDYALRKEL
jgi:hypothetical protein